MLASHRGLIFSATDLSNFLACTHLSLLTRRVALGGPRPRRYPDPRLDALRKRGTQHEQAYLERVLAGAPLTVATIAPPANDGRAKDDAWRVQANETLNAMRAGSDIIVQGALFDGTWFGRPDFMRKIARPSMLGDWSYEIVDTKLAREAKGGALLQILLYSDLLAAAQGLTPEYAWLALGGPDAREERFRIADFAAYFRFIRARFLSRMSEPEPSPLAVPEPVDHCAICDWSEICEHERRDVDHLSFVADISRRHRAALIARDIGTLGALARLELPLDPALDGVGAAALHRIHHQARLQADSRESANAKLRELLQPVVAGQGLAALPEPSPGDLFFDIEGNPYALTDGLEYLFGFVEPNGDYTSVWALDRSSEKEMFEQFVDLVVERRARWPDMHVYHYAPYEPTALKRLMSRHGAREDEVDELLRGDVFVDLYRAVKQGLRASVESYSIKKLEPFYGYERDVDLREATRAMVAFEAWLELGGDDEHEAQWEEIEGYNRDDCVSTLRLRDWLESLRAELEQTTGVPVPRRPAPSDEPDESGEERRAEVRALYARLMEGVPAEHEARTGEQNARWLAAHLVEYHRREKKAMWWEYFRCMALGDGELVEDRSVLGGLEYEGVIGREKKSVIHRYRFPLQDHGIRAGRSVVDKHTQRTPGRIVEIDPIACTVDIIRGEKSQVSHPRALVLKDDVRAADQQASILRVATTMAADGAVAEAEYPVAMDLLRRHPPRLASSADGNLMREGETTLEAAVRLVTQLHEGVLPIQGPPGAGKTFTAARMIVRAMKDGRRVGITATSHKVIGNLLDAVVEAARQENVTVSGVQKAAEDERCASTEIEAVSSNAEALAALTSGKVRLAAGTSWLWSRADMIGSVDILFVDEAGQFTLADAVAVSAAAPAMVLVGDPRQLEQPQQGVHPPGSHVSALDQMLLDSATISPERGLFLGETWRLHPDICAFTSEIFYVERLHTRPGLERQRVNGAGIFAGSGLRYVAVEHTGNQDTSAEEVRRVAEIVRALLERGSTWTDAAEKERALTAGDILIVAPYNVHVAAIARELRKSIPQPRVGTVDKFQGQEAPVVIYSMATSSPEDAPRGMQFLYNPSRLNVATSRARCLAIVVASPLLFAPECRTPAQMKLANAFCRFLEMAERDGGVAAEMGLPAGESRSHWPPAAG